MKPLLFNTKMVRAILEGRKIVTRRVVKLKYSNTHLEMFTNKYGTRLIEKQNEVPGVTTIKNPDGTTTYTLLACVEKEPPYRPSDILYVREAFRLVDFDFIDGDWSASVQYKAGEGLGPRLHNLRGGCNERAGWRPSIHMPREAARIFLRVTDVRAARLRPMSLDDFEAEGLSTVSGLFDTTARFADLWDSTIKPVDRALYGWETNPWVWVIVFERIRKKEAEF